MFWNALFYNEPGSQIATDADTLKVRPPIPFRPWSAAVVNLKIIYIYITIIIYKNILVSEWQKRSVLPSPRLSPPPASPQKVHGVLASAPPPAPGPSSITLLPPSEPVASTPEMDIDVGGGLSPDPDIDNDNDNDRGQSEEAGTASMAGDGDGDGEAIIRQLEKSLPRWEGFGDSGWMPDATKVSCLLCIGLVLRSRRHHRHDRRPGPRYHAAPFFILWPCVLPVCCTGPSVGACDGDQDP